MPSWTIDGLSLTLPEAMLTPGIARMCDKGWYETEERRALAAHLAPGDRLLELGGGAGFLACVAARALGAARVVTVEANPAMLPVIRANLAANGQEAVRLVHAAAVADGCCEMELHVPAAFWAASLEDAPGTRAVTVPARPAEALIADHDPTVLVVDVEGAEAGFFAHPLPGTLRLIVVELHPPRYPRAAIRDLFARLGARGFAYEPKGSSGAVVCFHRL